MVNLSKNKDLLNSLNKLWHHYQISISIILFILGILFRLFAIQKTGIGWQLLNDFGTFLAGSISISFIYTIFSKTNDRQIFINELEKLLDTKFNNYINTNIFPTFSEIGRVSIEEKVKLLEKAKKEIIHVGVASSSLANYFEQVPFEKFKKPVQELLKKGVNFKFLILNPDSDIAKEYAKDRGEIKLLEKIRNSIEIFEKLRDEFRNAGYSGEIQIFLYSHFPYCYVMMIDPTEPQGSSLVSHYLYATKRADTPVIEIQKASNPVLFNKYYGFLMQLIEDSDKL